MSRYAEIVNELEDLSQASIQNQNEKDKALRVFRFKQMDINKKIIELDAELKEVIQKDSERSKLYQKV